MSVCPRQLAFRGWEEVSALLLEDTPEGRRRALARWTPGVIVETTARGLLVHLPKPERMRCETAPGLPLLTRAGWIVGAPLSAAELKALEATPGSVLIPRAGQLETLKGTPADPASWIDLADFEVTAVSALADPVDSVSLAVVPRATDLRARIESNADAVVKALRSTGATPQRRWWHPITDWVAGWL